MAKASSKSTLWIWILLLLIALAVLGIIYRDKLRPYWFMLKSRFGGKGFGDGSITSGIPRGPPPSTPPSLRRASPFGGRRPMPRRFQGARPRGEIDEVLKKLKEIGK